jgi:hypothetical protein
MAVAKPRRVVLRKAADSDIHPAEPRVKAAPIRARAAAATTSGARAAAAPTPNGRTAKN